MIIRLLTGGAGQGLLWALLAIGVYITFRILNFADLTAEGSFALGGSVAATIIYDGGSNITALLLAVFAGAAAGFVTGLLHTKLKIPAILAGILTMTALYSINMRIMHGRPSLFLFEKDTLITHTVALLNPNAALVKLVGETVLAELILGAVFVPVVIVLLYCIFGTEQGSAIRATGSNEHMCRALGISTDNTKIIALMLSNAIIALSGALVAQSHVMGDVNMGTGAIVIGLASVIIGEAFTSQKFPFWAKLAFVALGSIIYRLIVILVINIDFFQPSDLKLFTAVVVVAALAISHLRKKMAKAQVRPAVNGTQGGGAVSDKD